MNMFFNKKFFALWYLKKSPETVGIKKKKQDTGLKIYQDDVMEKMDGVAEDLEVYCSQEERG